MMMIVVVLFSRNLLLCSVLLRLLLGSPGFLCNNLSHRLLVVIGYSRFSDMAYETRGMLGGIQNTLQAQIDVVISDVRTEAGQRISDVAKMYQATRETHDKLVNVRSEIQQMQTYMVERE